MDLLLKGKNVIVTGASRGIGRSIAETFADEGANVAICARTPGPVDDVVAGLKAKGVKAFGAGVDIADGPALQAWIAKAADQLGGVDVLVSNARRPAPRQQRSRLEGAVRYRRHGRRALVRSGQAVPREGRRSER
jgi:NAD(P)-dependent dehydrogenase (short-subunit alcohol dehydrogenase family)